jgi:hypothetical protein
MGLLRDFLPVHFDSNIGDVHMPGRTRSRSSSSNWEQEIYGSFSSGFQIDTTENCQDYYGPPFGENALTLIKDQKSGGCLNGSFSGRYYSNRATYIRDTAVKYPPASAYGTEKISDFATLAASRTNPSRPEIGLPQFIGELRDFPRMIQHAGRFLNGRAFKHGQNWLSAAKEVASENLAIQFGWAPLVSDLVKMVEFTESVEKRTKELNRLHSGSGLKRRIELGTTTVQDTVYSNAWSAHGVYLLNVPVHRTTSVKNWAVIKWQPAYETRFQKAAPDDVKRLILGLTPGNIAPTAWELLPWSWLVDYFTNFGNFISLTNNAVGAQCLGGTIMTQGTYTNEWEKREVAGGAINMNAGSRVRVSKLRRAFTPFDFSPISATFPILSGKQLSILSSLAVTRV